MEVLKKYQKIKASQVFCFQHDLEDADFDCQCSPVSTSQVFCLQHDLEDAANRPTSDSANEDEKPGQSIAQSVYSENRKKAGQVMIKMNPI